MGIFKVTFLVMSLLLLVNNTLSEIEDSAASMLEPRSADDISSGKSIDMSDRRFEPLSKSLENIGAFGLGLYGAGVFERLDRVQQSITRAQEHILSWVKSVRMQLKYTLRDLQTRLNSVTSDLGSKRNALVDKIKDTPTTRGDNTKCMDEFNINLDGINMKIYGLETIIVDEPSTQDISINIEIVAMQNQMYNEIVPTCRREYPMLMSQISNIEMCARRLVDVIETEVSDNQNAAFRNINNLRTRVSTAINNVSRDVVNLINKASTDFTGCVKVEPTIAT